MDEQNYHPHRGKILIIDDTPYNLKILSHLLTEKGHEVRKALNEEMALMAIKTDPPDLILLDILMPDVDGYQICEQLKASKTTADIPIIFLTAVDDVDSKVKAFALGGVDYITKPFHFGEILARVETQLTLRFFQKTLALKNQQLQQQNQHLQKMNADLQKTNADLREFAYRVSEHLKFPLQGILENIQGLFSKYQDLMDDETNGYINQTIQLTQRMKQLINHLFEYFNSSQKNRPEFRLINCQTVVETILENLSSEIQKTGAIVTYETLPILQMDSRDMTQILQNLMSNSIKFAKLDTVPEIRIYAEYIKYQDNSEDSGNSDQTNEANFLESQGEWVFTVQDNGIGIDRQHLDKLFQLFYRVEKHEKNYPGIGLGMAICRKIVESYGGRIWVESELGVGSSVYFTIPD
jgi:two-component system sensor histidine kinase/response regulator